MLAGTCEIRSLFVFATPLSLPPPWEHWGGDGGGSRFSPLAQITPGNVGNLVRAWEFRTGDLASRAPEAMKRTKFQATPLFVEDSLIFCSPFNEVVALDPGSARQSGASIQISHQPAPGQSLQLPRRGLSTRVCRQCRLPRAAVHGHQRRARDRARRPHRQALRRFRQQRRDQARDRRAGMAGRIQITSAPVVARRRHRRLCRRGQSPRRARPARCGLRARTGRPRWNFDPLHDGIVAGHQCLGADVGGRERDLVFLPTSSRVRISGAASGPATTRTPIRSSLRATTGEIAWCQTVHRRLGLRFTGATDAGASRYGEGSAMS